MRPFHTTVFPSAFTLMDSLVTSKTDTTHFTYHFILTPFSKKIICDVTQETNVNILVTALALPLYKYFKHTVQENYFIPQQL
jgi:hypothetical protein